MDDMGRVDYMDWMDMRGPVFGKEPSAPVFGKEPEISDLGFGNPGRRRERAVS